MSPSSTRLQCKCSDLHLNDDEAATNQNQTQQSITGSGPRDLNNAIGASIPTTIKLTPIRQIETSPQSVVTRAVKLHEVIQITFDFLSEPADLINIKDDLEASMALAFNSNNDTTPLLLRWATNAANQQLLPGFKRISWLLLFRRHDINSESMLDLVDDS